VAIEIERKFLLNNDDWKKLTHTFKHYKQAYFCNTAKVSVRVRVTDDAAWMSFKSSTIEISRFEYEYVVPLEDALHMIEQFSQGSVISKTRYFVPVGPHIWEIDIFDGDNDGLIVAEIELGHVDESFEIPTWVGQEVSDDVRYFNSNLVSNPYVNW